MGSLVGHQVITSTDIPAFRSSEQANLSAAKEIDANSIRELQEQLKQANHHWDQIKAELIRQKHMSRATGALGHGAIGEEFSFPVLIPLELPPIQLSTIQHRTVSSINRRYIQVSLL
jgi:hypothetical protein